MPVSVDLNKLSSVYSKHHFCLRTFKYIKAVSDTVLDMLNAAYHDKPWIFTRAIRLSL